MRWRRATAVLCLLVAGCSQQRPPTGSDVPLSARLASADPAEGGRIFRQCAACHNLSDGGTDRDGPNLWGVLGKPLATASRRFAYTAALKSAGSVWTCARLDDWLKSPAALVPGTSMIYPGLPDGGQRADVIAYLARSGGTSADATCAPLRGHRS
jgi:cytochrome c